jgi:hypothetical protein
MQLSEDLLKTLLARLDERWPEPRHCPACRQTNWTLIDRVFEIREFAEGSLILGGPVVPVILATCTTCGHEMVFNAIALGVVVAPKTEPILPEDPVAKVPKPEPSNG